MSFNTKIIGTTGFKILYDLDQGLKNTGRSREWNIGVDSIYRAIPDQYEINAVLINEDGETIGRTSGRLAPGRNYDFSDKDLMLRFSGVNANKITDRLTVSIVSVNGMDAKTAGERGYMSISTEDSALFFSSSVDWRFGDAKITKFANNRYGPTSVIIPDSVTFIGESAFASNQIASVTMGNSVTSIGRSTFANNQIASVAIGNNVTSIGESAFANNQLASVVIPDSVTFIGESAFANNQLASVTIGNSVTSIGSAAFANNQISSVAIPNNVTSIGSEAFYRNQLTSVIIPDNVTSIGSEAFRYNHITSVAIGNGITYIGYNVFRYNWLTSVALPANVQWDVSNIDSSLRQAYESNGKKAGTYVRVGDTDNWRMR
jgi:hypothetical protein